METDILIVGSGAAGLYCALNLPKDKNILIITKTTLEESDSYLAQGGMCVLASEDDYKDYFEDTMKAGHYENNKKSVEIMIKSSKSIAKDLIKFGVDFENKNGKLLFTKEGGHSKPRILYHEDTTGKEITSKLLKNVKKLENVTILENFTMIDIIEDKGCCYGIVATNKNGDIQKVSAKCTVFACGGLGGLYKNSTNFPHLTADAIAIAINHNITLENIDYIQIHPTTLYSKKSGRRFLISESVRGEGAVLLNKDKKRFTDELKPRDIVTREIHKQMKKDNMPYVWLSMSPIDKNVIKTHFCNIYKKCLEEGYDVTKECIPVVPSQHYFMGGIKVNTFSKTSMDNLYAIGEVSCNGVHGKNRLASNSLLEGLVFAKRAAKDICVNIKTIKHNKDIVNNLSTKKYENYNNIKEEYKKLVLEEIEREKCSNE